MNNHQPRVSIGLPVYNGENFLREAIESILAQTFADFELIISDNDSTDKTAEICREYAAKDKRIQYYRNEHNIGAAPNYNRVFQLSKGEYFKWAAHDDKLAPEYLQKCVDVLDKNPTCVVSYSRLIYINQQGESLKKCSNLLDLRSSNPQKRFGELHNLFNNGRGRYDRWTVIFGLIRVSALKQTPLMGSYIGSDVTLLARLSFLGEFYEVPEYLFYIREHTNRSVHRSYQEIAAWFDPLNKGKIVFPLWREFFENIFAIQDSNLSFQDKISCYTDMGRWISWRWKRLVKEVIMVPKQILLKSSIQKW